MLISDSMEIYPLISRLAPKGNRQNLFGKGRDRSKAADFLTRMEKYNHHFALKDDLDKKTYFTNFTEKEAAQ